MSVPDKNYQIYLYNKYNERGEEWSADSPINITAWLNNEILNIVDNMYYLYTRWDRYNLFDNAEKAAISASLLELINFRAGTNPNMRTSRGESLLIAICIFGFEFEDVAMRLIEMGADLNARHPNGWSLFEIASHDATPLTRVMDYIRHRESMSSATGGAGGGASSAPSSAAGGAGGGASSAPSSAAGGGGGGASSAPASTSNADGEAAFIHANWTVPNNLFVINHQNGSKSLGYPSSHNYPKKKRSTRRRSNNRKTRRRNRRV